LFWLEIPLKRNFPYTCTCAGCSGRLKIEFLSEPIRTGSMWTVDCPACGMSKMVPDEPVRIFLLKDASWIEFTPKTQHVL